MLTPDQKIKASEIIVLAMELQRQITDAAGQEILAHVISKLHELVWIGA